MAATLQGRRMTLIEAPVPESMKLIAAWSGTIM
jgi:hypothetical protein